MGAKVTLREHEYTRRSHGFKLMKRLTDDGKVALFSDSKHYSFEMLGPRDPHATYVSDEM
jgi:hypothetical protein